MFFFVSFAPAEPFTNRFFGSCFFRQIFGFFFFFLDIWVLRDPTFAAKKKTKNKNIRKRLGNYLVLVYVRCDLILVLCGQFFEHLR